MSDARRTPQALAARLAEPGRSGLDPADVAAQVLTAMRDKELYVFHTFEFGDGVGGAIWRHPGGHGQDGGSLMMLPMASRLPMIAK